MAKRHGAEFWRGHLEAWLRSDLTQREYCATYGLGEGAFRRWRRREKQAAAGAKSPLSLVP
ncbi:MAG: IS66 family insertion sequence element accessory protein TnpA, partial [Thiobacillaceae bacterium]